jgi:hypothetical protein
MLNNRPTAFLHCAQLFATGETENFISFCIYGSNFSVGAISIDTLRLDRSPAKIDLPNPSDTNSLRLSLTKSEPQFSPRSIPELFPHHPNLGIKSSFVIPIWLRNDRGTQPHVIALEPDPFFGVELVIVGN